MIGEDLDLVDVLISKIELNSFIETSEESQIAWFYAHSNIRPGFIKVVSDNIEMARVSSMRELLQQRVTDYVFYYNFLTTQLFTLFRPNRLVIDGTLYQCEPVQQINYFDEFGLKVGLQRLYLETNNNFKKRILDVYQNPPAINLEGLKKTLRRELDIWRVFGSTPDSLYFGATPEILEISDIEKNQKYFNQEGIPTEDFKDFVEYLNKKYPSNFGYIKWGQAYWDPAGTRREGFASLPQITDSATTEYYIENYQPGIGDFNDIKLKLEKLDFGTGDYGFNLKAHGFKTDGVSSAYEPIEMVYDSFVSYHENYIENDVATVSYDVVLGLNLHGNIPNDSEYTARYKVLVKNNYSNLSDEFISKDIFSATNFTNGESIYYNIGGTPYTNTLQLNATESYTFTQVPLYAVDTISINLISAQNPYGISGDYGKISFLNSTPNQYATSTSPTISKTALQIGDSPYATKLKIASKIYNPTKRRLVNTPKIRSNRFGNVLNSSNDITKKSDIHISPASIIKDFTIPYGATPLYVHIENVVEGDYDIDGSSSPYQGYGGIALNKQDNLKYLIPSSDNIVFQFINPNFSTPHQHSHYINTLGSSTVNYKFIDVKFPYNATPDLLVISSTPSGNFYPFNYETHSLFDADYIGEIDFRITNDGVITSGATKNYSFHNEFHLIGGYDFERSDFGLEEYASSPNLTITSIKAYSDNDDIIVSAETFDDNLESTFDRLNHYDNETNQFISKDIYFDVSRPSRLNDRIYPSIESGFIHLNATPYYLYADPEREFYYNQSEFILPSVARQGAPILVQVGSSFDTDIDSTPYAQVAFMDEASPSVYSKFNVEFIEAVYDNYLALGYNGVFEVSVLDTYTNDYVIQNQSYSSNIIKTLNANGIPQIKSGRTYKVKYRLKNVFNADNQYYNEFDNSYRTKVTLLSTPNYPYYAKVTYEKSMFDSDTVFDETSLNPLYSAMSEGYVYFSTTDYPLSSVEAYISPKEILDDGSQFIAINIFSIDENNNPKPHIAYGVTGENISATPSYVYTNEDGYARAYGKYVGDEVSTPSSYSIFVSEISESDSTPNTSATVSYYVKPITMTSQKLSAEVTKKIINADGQETVYIYGSATPNAKVYWRRARNLFNTFGTPYSKSQAAPDQNGKAGMTTADSLGNFQIGGYRAQNDATPGYWFVAVDTEMLPSQAQGTPNTVAGDIVYWYERYDVNQSNSSEPVLAATLGENTGYYHYSVDSSFKKNYVTEKVYYQGILDSGWQLPKWYPIDRYTQYQMGLLGATPYVVDTYENLHPDYEEE